MRVTWNGGLCVWSGEHRISYLGRRASHISDHQKNRSVTHKGCNKHRVPPGPGDWQGRDQHTQQELGSTDRTGLELRLVYKQAGEDIDDALKLYGGWGGWFGLQNRGRLMGESSATLFIPSPSPETSLDATSSGTSCPPSSSLHQNHLCLFIQPIPSLFSPALHSPVPAMFNTFSASRLWRIHDVILADGHHHKEPFLCVHRHFSWQSNTLRFAGSGLALQLLACFYTQSNSEQRSS